MYSKCPQTLSKLILDLNKFRNLDDVYKNSLNYEMQVLNDNSLYRGVSAKKVHEINQMVPFVRHFCEKYKCKYLIDVGSGLVSVIDCLE